MKIRSLLGLVLIVSACSEEEVDRLIEPDLITKPELTQITMVANGFLCEDGLPTRTVADVGTGERPILWADKDTVGIFPNVGDQVAFPMENGEGSSSASFNGGGWALKGSSTYYAYYPFSRKNFDAPDKMRRLPYTFLGQKAVYEDANKHVSIGKFAYMYAQASTPVNGGVNFQFAHLGALCRLGITFPETGIYTGLTINASEKVFPLEGTFDLTASTMTLNASAKASEFTIDLQNLSATAGETKNIYFMLPPADCSKLSVFNAILKSNSNEYDATLKGKNIEAGKAYGWDIQPSVLTNPNLSLLGTANCYIVTKSGAYSFNAVKGNSDESVGAVGSVTVLWESYGTSTNTYTGNLVNNVTYDNGVISFEASDKKGNALIAAKDASGTILWSWHIWLTDKPKGQVYVNDAGTIMDRNLGATSTTPGSITSWGLLYQWGRKDPFLGSTSISAGTQVASTLSQWPVEESTASTGTIAYTISHPTTFIALNVDASTATVTPSTQDWYYSNDKTTDNTRWTSTKTIYDPCPVGYRVADANVWITAFGAEDMNLRESDGDGIVFDSANSGYNLGASSEKKLTNDMNCWYPVTNSYSATGAFQYTSDYQYAYGSVWTCTPNLNGYNAYAPGFGRDGGISVAAPYAKRACGYSVRCQRE